MVSTKTRLLKHYYRRQGNGAHLFFPFHSRVSEVWSGAMVQTCRRGSLWQWAAWLIQEMSSRSLPPDAVARSEGYSSRTANGMAIPEKKAQAFHVKSSRLRSHLGTLALKTEDFSTKIDRFSETQKWISEGYSSRTANGMAIPEKKAQEFHVKSSRLVKSAWS